MEGCCTPTPSLPLMTRSGPLCIFFSASTRRLWEPPLSCIDRPQPCVSIRFYTCWDKRSGVNFQTSWAALPWGERHKGWFNLIASRSEWFQNRSETSKGAPHEAEMCRHSLCNITATPQVNGSYIPASQYDKRELRCRFIITQNCNFSTVSRPCKLDKIYKLLNAI